MNKVTIILETQDGRKIEHGYTFDLDIKHLDDETIRDAISYVMIEPDTRVGAGLSEVLSISKKG